MSMNQPKSQGMSHVDPPDPSPQVTKSHVPDNKVTALPPPNVTFSGPSLKGPERDPEGEGDQQTPPPVAPDPDLAARRTEALNRLRRPLTRRTEKP